MKIDYTKLIVSKLKRAGKKPVRYKELLRDCKRKHFDIDKFNDTVAAMKRRGEITETKFGFSLGEKKKDRRCKVVRAFAASEMKNSSASVVLKLPNSSMGGSSSRCA